MEWNEWTMPSGKVEVAVFDAYDPIFDDSRCAAMLVPQGRERDWIFSTPSGLEQLFADSGLTMLILIFRAHQTSTNKEWELRDGGPEEQELKQSLKPRLIQLVESRTGLDIENVPFAAFQDNVVWYRVVERVSSRKSGRMLVEDVRLDCGALRRRLRFKSMPNLIQTEVPLRRRGDADADADSDTAIDHGVLVHVYLAPLAAGFSLISRSLESCSAAGRPARVLCIGVGGGALPMFLSTAMSDSVAALDVEAVDSDQVVLDLARRHFGLVQSGNLRVRVEDGLESVKTMARSSSSDDEKVADSLEAIVVDVGDGSNSCPPREFVEVEFLRAARAALDPGGMLAMNVIPEQPQEESHRALLKQIATVFDEVYQLRVPHAENRVVFALKTALQGISAPLTCKIGKLLGDELLDNIHRVDTSF